MPMFPIEKPVKLSQQNMVMAVYRDNPEYVRANVSSGVVVAAVHNRYACRVPTHTVHNAKHLMRKSGEWDTIAARPENDPVAVLAPQPAPEPTPSGRAAALGAAVAAFAAACEAHGVDPGTVAAVLGTLRDGVETDADRWRVVSAAALLFGRD